jgi:hypothetical protein
MIHFTYKLELNERVRAKCSRHPATTRGSRHWRMACMLITSGSPSLVNNQPIQLLRTRRPRRSKLQWKSVDIRSLSKLCVHIGDYLS